MGWATGHIAKLKQGHTVQFRPRGNSMTGLIESGALVTVAPLVFLPTKGDVVLCKVKGSEYLHLVKAVREERFQIGNNKGGINGWVGLASIYGKVTKIEK